MKSSNYWRKRANRTNNPCDWFTDKNLKYQVRKLIRAAESEFVKDQTQNNPRNMQIVFEGNSPPYPSFLLPKFVFYFYR